MNERVSVEGLPRLPTWRSRIVLFVFFAAFSAITGRAIWVQGLASSFFIKQGQIRNTRILEVTASRGKIFDRNDRILAASMPARSLYFAGAIDSIDKKQVRELNRLLGTSDDEVGRASKMSKGDFHYLRRNVDPAIAASVVKLGIDGLFSKTDPSRIYPSGTDASSIVGVINENTHGENGLEKSYDTLLHGKPGQRRVTKDPYGRIIEESANSEPVVQGHDIHSSLDIRWQIFARSALERAFSNIQGLEASLLLVDPNTGEILAITTKNNNNSNASAPLPAVAKTFEPGLTLAPFIIAAGVKNDVFTFDTRYSAAGPLLLEAAGRNHAPVTEMIRVRDMLAKRAKSSVAVAGIHIKPNALRDALDSIGIGTVTETGLPGEARGRLPPASWRIQDHAMIAAGRHVTVTLAQLARSYAILVNGGSLRPLSILRQQAQLPHSSVFSEKIAIEVLNLLAADTTIVSSSAAERQKIKIISDVIETTSLRLGVTETRSATVAVGIFSDGQRRFVGTILVELPKNKLADPETATRKILSFILRKGSEFIQN